MGFARIKAILDQGIATWERRPGNHVPANLSVHGATFSWVTKSALLAAEGHGRRLIAPEVIGNGKGAEAVLVIDLRTGVAGPATRMPHGGPYLPDSQIQEIEDWINAGCPD
jgi:hypothetical protein